MKESKEIHNLHCDGCHARLYELNHRDGFEDEKEMIALADREGWDEVETATGIKTVCKNCLKVVENLYPEDLRDETPIVAADPTKVNTLPPMPKPAEEWQGKQATKKKA